jgi:hypothetical protein
VTPAEAGLEPPLPEAPEQDEERPVAEPVEEPEVAVTEMPSEEEDESSAA